MNKSLAFFVAVLLVVFEVAFFERNAADYISYADLKWVSVPECVNQVITDLDSGSEGLKLANTSMRCGTEGFDIKSPIFRFYISSADPKRAVTPEQYELKLKSPEKQIEVNLPGPLSLGFGWTQIVVELSETQKKDFLNSKAVLEITKKSEALSPGIIVRDRLEFIDEVPTVLDQGLESLFQEDLPRVVLQLIIFVLVIVSLGTLNNFNFLISLFVLTISFHFQLLPFFYYDEWHIFQRFSEKSFLDAVNYTHNEHYLPLFFIFYYIEAKILGDFYQAYLLVSCFLIALTGFSLVKLLRELGFSKYSSRFLGVLFCASSMIAEIAQWSLEQCIAISAIAGISAIIYGLRYLKSENFIDLFRCGFLLLLTPFFFGGGFTYAPIVLMFVGLYLIFKTERVNFKETSKKFIYICLIVSVFTSVPVLLYEKYKDSSAGHAVDKTSFFAEKIKQTNYFFQGTGVGSILRPLGFYPPLSIRSPQEVIAEATGVNLTKISPRRFIILTSLAGFMLVAALYVLVIKTGHLTLRDGIFYFCCGIGFISMFFVLLSMGRWKLGENQSLSLRYQYQVLPGLLIALAPFIDYLISKQHIKVYRNFSLTALALWVFVQVCALEDFKYFQFNGDIDRLYIQAAAESINKDGQVVIENPALLPVHIPSITPGRGMPELVRTYYWLKGELWSFSTPLIP